MSKSRPGKQLLIGISLAMIAVGLLGSLSFRALLPSAASEMPGRYDWPSVDDQRRELSAAEQRAALEPYAEAARSPTMRFLAGSRTRAMRWLEAPVTDEEAILHLKLAVDRVRTRAVMNAWAVIVIFGCMVVAGVLGLARLRAQHTVAIGAGLLVLVALGGGTSLYFMEGGVLFLIAVLAFLASVALMFAANLLPDARHQFVLAVEREMLVQPPDRRRQYLVRRMTRGAATLAFGLVMTGISIAIGGPIVVVATGAMAVGCLDLLAPLIVAVRLRDEAPAAPAIAPRVQTGAIDAGPRGRLAFAASTAVRARDGIATVRAATIDEACAFAVIEGFSQGGPGPGLSCAYAADATVAALRAAGRDGDVAESIDRAVQAAHAAIRQLDDGGGSGASMLVIAAGDNGWFVGHVGGARLYRIRGRHVVPITVDHSLINDVIREKGLVGSEAAMVRAEAPHRRVIVRAVGVRDSVTPEIAQFDVRRGDLLALVTPEVALRVDADPTLLVEVAQVVDPAALVAAFDRSAQATNDAVVALQVL